NIDAAWKFVAFSAGPEGARLIAAIPGGMPARPTPIEWFPETLVNPEIFGDLMNFGRARLVSRDRVALGNIISQELGPVWQGAAAPRSAALEVARRMNAFLQE